MTGNLKRFIKVPVKCYFVVLKLTSIFTSFYWHCELCKQNTVIKKRGQNFFMRTKRGGTISKYRLLLVPHPPLPHYASDPSFPASFRVESHPFAFWEGRKYRGHFALITELLIWLLATFCRTIDPGTYTGYHQRDWIFRSAVEMSTSSEDGGVNLHIPKKVSRTNGCSNLFV